MRPEDEIADLGKDDRARHRVRREVRHAWHGVDVAHAGGVAGVYENTPVAFATTVPSTVPALATVTVEPGGAMPKTAVAVVPKMDAALPPPPPKTERKFLPAIGSAHHRDGRGRGRAGRIHVLHRVPGELAGPDHRVDVEERAIEHDEADDPRRRAGDHDSTPGSTDVPGVIFRDVL